MKLNQFLESSTEIGLKPNHEIEVLVIVLCYNQVNFIESAIKSVLSQEYSGSWHIVVHDDASDDGSEEIIRQVVQMNETKVSAILQGRNKFGQGINYITEIQNLISAKFIARLDGDDYWIDIKKITRQVGILKENSDVSLVFNSYKIFNQVDGTYAVFSLKSEGIINSKKLARCNFIHTCTVMYRANKVFPLPTKLANYLIWDFPTWATLSSRGKLYYCAEIVAVNRRYSENTFAGKPNKEFRDSTLQIYNYLIDFLPSRLARSWKFIYQLRRVCYRLDTITSNFATTLLNTILNRSVGIRFRDEIL